MGSQSANQFADSVLGLLRFGRAQAAEPIIAANVQHKEVGGIGAISAVVVVIAVGTVLIIVDVVNINIVVMVADVGGDTDGMNLSNTMRNSGNKNKDYLLTYLNRMLYCSILLYSIFMFPSYYWL
jgi:hypothetical protein